MTGCRLPGQAMADLLMVFEFLHNFGETLGFGKYSITSLPSFVLIDTQGKIVARMVASEVVTELQKWLSPL